MIDFFQTRKTLELKILSRNEVETEIGSAFVDYNSINSQNINQKKPNVRRPSQVPLFPKQK